MTTLTICNFALSRVTAPRIQNINDATREARECKLWFDQLRDEVLSRFAWTFAKKKVLLAEVEIEEGGEWLYGYALPSDCLTPRAIYNPSGQDAEAIRFEVADGILYTDQEEATLVYTYRVEDSNKFDASFVDALAWRLSAELAIPLKNSLALREGNMKRFDIAIEKASSKNMNIGTSENPEVDDFVSARD